MHTYSIIINFLSFSIWNLRLIIGFVNRITGYMCYSKTTGWGSTGYLTVLLASDFYSNYYWCSFTLKTEFSRRFPINFVKLSWIWWTALMYQQSYFTINLIIFKTLEISSYLLELKFSINDMVRDFASTPRLLILPKIFAHITLWFNKTIKKQYSGRRKCWLI